LVGLLLEYRSYLPLDLLVVRYLDRIDYRYSHRAILKLDYVYPDLAGQIIRCHGIRLLEEVFAVRMVDRAYKYL
jgi:hypothetical protein